MHNKSIVIVGLCALVAASLACSVPTGQTAAQPDYPLTITAQAAQLAETGSPVTATSDSGQGTLAAPSSATAAAAAAAATKTPKPTPKATKTPKPVTGALPNPPAFFSVNAVCKLAKTNLGTYNYDMTFQLSWSPPLPSDLVQGYRIYRDNKLADTFEVGQVGWSDKVTINGVSAVSLPTVTHTYAIESFNLAGSSKRETGTAQCP